MILPLQKTPQKTEPHAPTIIVYPSIIEKSVNWYKENHEMFPWREKKEPQSVWAYSVWVSEIMLQQTTVRTVIPYFIRFMARFPTVNDLGNASIDEVLNYWQGLGYYRRAHQLHKAAIIIVKDFDGMFPTTFEGLKALPGIGDYTAAAIMAIAYNQPYVPIDGNVFRVFSRLFALKYTVKGLLKIIKPYEKECESVLMQKKGDSAFFAQSLMDLGREVCTPKSPKCSICPIHGDCRAYGLGIQENFPIKEVKRSIPTRYATCWIYKDNKKIFIQKRREKGLLSGLWQCPMTDFTDSPLKIDESMYISTVQHIFSHFKLIVSIHHGKNINDTCHMKGEWVSLDNLSDYAFSTLMQKIFKEIK
ncbi:MAG: A/G-specific adenine glycosylase [Alphaproteobacteria bacterium]|nr:A/G-specific adenine glycosylase [Alphaproteobacteria bacterium]